MGPIVCPEITEFRNNLSVPSSGGQELLTFENGTDSLCRNYRVSGQPINSIFRGSRIIDIWKWDR